MRFFTTIVGFLLVASLCEAAVVQRRIYRNTKEVLVPVTVIQDGDEIKEVKEVNVVVNKPEVINIETETIAEDIAKVVDEEQKLEAVVEAQRRFDEAIVEEEIKEVVAEENKELLKAVAEEEIIEKEIIKTDEKEEEKEEELKSIAEIPQEAVLQPEIIETVEELVKPEATLQQIKSVEKEIPNQVVVLVAANEDEQPEDSVRQATQATPTPTTPQQNFVQQLIQNSPLGQFFNQITGQQAQVANDEGAAAPATPSPTIPGFLNPVAAITNAAQSAVNSTTQAFQGIQQFASNLGNQFQNTFSGLTGQQQLGANDATTVRPPGPIQQLVNTFMGGNNQQQAQPAPGQQQGPLQGLLNIFQGTNRPQGSTAAITNLQPQPAKQPEIIEQTIAADEEIAADTADDIKNEVRDSTEVADSFEDTVQPEEMIVVNDDASQIQEIGTGQEHVAK